MTESRITAATNHDQPWSPYGGAGLAPSVLLVLDHTAPSRAAVIRACRLSRLLDATLQIVDVVPVSAAHPAGTSVISRAAHLPGGERCDVEITYGEVRESAERAISRYRPVIVVMGAARGVELACELVDRGRVTVIVARPERTNGPFIAASDMGHVGFPVVARALELAERYARELTLFHNANAYPRLAGNPMEPPTRYASISDLMEATVAAKVTRLRGIAGGHERVDAVISRSQDTEASVLELARERDADLVIVGRRAPSWLGRVLGHHLTEHLLERCQRSVMIVPVAAAA